jgi:hypothetical protein
LVVNKGESAGQIGKASQLSRVSQQDKWARPANYQAESAGQMGMASQLSS